MSLHNLKKKFKNDEDNPKMDDEYPNPTPESEKLNKGTRRNKNNQDLDRIKPKKLDLTLKKTEVQKINNSKIN